MERTDEELVAEYVKGNEAAFNELTKRTLPSVYSFVLRLVSDPEAAEDISQETFVKAWRSLKKYDQNSSKFKTWLLRIARNTAIDYLRKRKHIPLSAFETNEGSNVLAETVPADEESITEKLERIDDAKAVQGHLEKLSPKHREILTLYYTNNFTFEDIAHILNEPTNTVKSRHRRALIALRDSIAPESGDASYK